MNEQPIYNPCIIKPEDQNDLVAKNMTTIEGMGIDSFMNDVLSTDFFNEVSCLANNNLYTDTHDFSLPNLKQEDKEYEEWIISRVFLTETNSIVAVIRHPDDIENEHPVYVRLTERG